MSKWLVFLCVLPLALSTTAFAQDAPVTDCDTYAGSDQDPQRKTAGMPIDRINPALAVPACEAAVRQYPNSSRLAFELGRAFTKANNFTAAMLQYRKAADQGYAFAQNNLGAMYENGQGVAKDYAQAVVWYRKAAAQGIELAKANLKRLSAQDAAGPPASADQGNWFETYVVAHGGCSRMGAYPDVIPGMRSHLTATGMLDIDLFGKPAIKWSDDDIARALRVFHDCEVRNIAATTSGPDGPQKNYNLKFNLKFWTFKEKMFETGLRDIIKTARNIDSQEKTQKQAKIDLEKAQAESRRAQAEEEAERKEQELRAQAQRDKEAADEARRFAEREAPTANDTQWLERFESRRAQAEEEAERMKEQELRAQAQRDKEAADEARRFAEREEPTANDTQWLERFLTANGGCGSKYSSPLAPYHMQQVQSDVRAGRFDTTLFGKPILEWSDADVASALHIYHDCQAQSRPDLAALFDAWQQWVPETVALARNLDAQRKAQQQATIEQGKPATAPAQGPPAALAQNTACPYPVLLSNDMQTYIKMFSQETLNALATGKQFSDKPRTITIKELLGPIYNYMAGSGSGWPKEMTMAVSNLMSGPEEDIVTCFPRLELVRINSQQYFDRKAQQEPAQNQRSKPPSPPISSAHATDDHSPYILSLPDEYMSNMRNNPAAAAAAANVIHALVNELGGESSEYKKVHAISFGDKDAYCRMSGHQISCLKLEQIPPSDTAETMGGFPRCDSDAMLADVKSIPLHNAFGVPITVFAIKNAKGSLSPPTANNGLGGLNCFGEGYLSTGIHMLSWEVRWMDDTKTQTFISVRIN